MKGALAVLILGVMVWVGFKVMSQEVPEPGHVLVVVAHPDDETMIAGTLMYLQSQGKSIKIAYATDGEGGRVFRVGESGLVAEEFPKEALRALRVREMERALEQLGVTDWVRFGAPDDPIRGEGGEPSTDLEGFLKAEVWNSHLFYQRVLELMREYRPELVITMGHAAPVHAHHKAIGFITLQAAESLAYLPPVYAISEHRWHEDNSTARHEFTLDLNTTWPTETGSVPLGEIVYHSLKQYQTQPAGLVGVPRDTERLYLLTGPVYNF